MAHRINPKYILVLTVAAVLMLALGVLLKPEKHTQAQPAAEVPTLQRLARGEGVRGMVTYLSERAAVAARHVVRLDGREGSGVVWGEGGQAVTAAGNPRVLLPVQSVPAAPDRLPASTAAELPAAQVPVLVVARRSDGAPLWSSATYQGQGEAHCGAGTFAQLFVAVPAHEQYDGAGVFLLDGSLAGVVGRCAGERVVVAASSLRPLLEQWDSEVNQIASRFGFAAVPLDEAARAYFGQDSGLLVRTVWKGSAADAEGLRPGDIITEPHNVNGEPLALTVARGRRTFPMTLRPDKESSSLGLAAVDAEGPSIRVAGGTPAFRAGLRTGDRILQIGDRRPVRGADLRRLESEGNKPVFVVYQRGDEQTGVLIAP